MSFRCAEVGLQLSKGYGFFFSYALCYTVFMVVMLTVAMKIWRALPCAGKRLQVFLHEGVHLALVAIPKEWSVLLYL